MSLLNKGALVIKFINLTKVKDDESLYSFLYRAINLNYYNDIDKLIRTVLRIQKGQNSNYIIDMSKLKFLASLVDLDTKKMNSLTLNKFNEKLLGNNKAEMNIRKYTYCLMHTKYCPYCIKEDLYHRLIWDISIVTSCPKHKINLLEICPRCKKKILWSHLMENRCSCGFIFTDGISYVQFQNQEVLKGQEYIQVLLNSENECNTELDYKFEEYFKIYFLMLRVISNIVPIKLDINGYLIEGDMLNSGFLIKKDIQTLSQISTIVHNIIVSPNLYFPYFLSEIDNFKKGMKNWKYKYLKEIYKLEIGLRFHHVHSIYLEELSNTYIGRRRGDIKSIFREREYIGINDAKKTLNIKDIKINRLIEEGLIKTKVTNFQNKKVRLIEKRSVEDYLIMKKTLLTIEEVCEILGLSKSKVLQLCENELLLPFNKPRNFSDNEILFSKINVDNLVRNIISKCCTNNYEKINKLNWITIEEAYKELFSTKFNEVDIICHIINTNIKIRNIRNFKSIKELEISRKDFFDFLLEVKYAKGFSLNKLCRILGVGYTTLVRFIQSGEINVTYTTTNENCVSYKYVNLDEVIKYLMFKYKITKKVALESIEMSIFNK